MKRMDEQSMVDLKVTLFSAVIGSDYLLRRPTLCFAVSSFEVVIIKRQVSENTPTKLNDTRCMASFVATLSQNESRALSSNLSQ